MDSIFLKNKKYIKASAIAKELGYTSDYIGQLCRGGKVEAELVGRTWYVADEAIREHKKNRYRSTAKATKRSLEKMVLSEPLLKSEKVGYKARVNYESDKAALMPQPRKQAQKEAVVEADQIQVVSDEKVHEVRLKDLTREPKTGTLRINIATEEPEATAEPIEIASTRVEPVSVRPHITAVETATIKKPTEVRFTPSSIATSPSHRPQKSAAVFVVTAMVVSMLVAMGINFISTQVSYSPNNTLESKLVIDFTTYKTFYNALVNNNISF